MREQGHNRGRSPAPSSPSGYQRQWLRFDVAADVLAVVQRSPLGATLGRERMLFNLEMAVERYLAAEPARVTARAAAADEA